MKRLAVLLAIAASAYALPASSQQGVWKAQIDAGDRALREGDLDRADHHYASALKMLEATPNDHARWGDVYVRGGDLSMARRQFKRAEEFFDGALAKYQRASAHQGSIAAVEARLSDALLAEGELGRAKEHRSKAIAIYEALAAQRLNAPHQLDPVYPFKNWRHAARVEMVELSHIHLLEGRPMDAVAVATGAVDGARSEARLNNSGFLSFPGASEQACELSLRAGEYLKNSGRLSDAEKFFAVCTDVRREAYEAEADRNEGESLSSRLRARVDSRPPVSSATASAYADALGLLAEVIEAQGRADEARRLRSRSKAVLSDRRDP